MTEEQLPLEVPEADLAEEIPVDPVEDDELVPDEERHEPSLVDDEPGRPHDDPASGYVVARTDPGPR